MIHVAKASRNSLVTSLKKARLAPEVVDQLESFFEFMPPSEFRNNLIELYHQYIFHQHECLPHNFKRFSESMIIFLDFLKAAEEERKGQA